MANKENAALKLPSLDMEPSQRASFEPAIVIGSVTPPAGVAVTPSVQDLREFGDSANDLAEDEQGALRQINEHLMRENAYLRIEMQQQVSLRSLLNAALVELEQKHPMCSSDFREIIRRLDQHEHARRTQFNPESEVIMDAAVNASHSNEDSQAKGASALIIQLNEALRRTIDQKEKNDHALALRTSRLLMFAKKIGVENEVQRILAGSPLPFEPPSYSQMANTLRFRAERAEREVTHYMTRANELEKRNDQLIESFMRTVRNLEAENMRLRATHNADSTTSVAQSDGAPS